VAWVLSSPQLNSNPKPSILPYGPQESQKGVARLSFLTLCRCSEGVPVPGPVARSCGCACVAVAVDVSAVAAPVPVPVLLPVCALCPTPCARETPSF